MAHASVVLDAHEQTIHDRRPAHRGGLIHHSERGSQYVSIKYTECAPRPGSSRRSGVSATVMTTPSPRRSMTFTRPRRSTGEVRGDPLRLSICDARMGRLVQQQAAAGAHQQYPTRRSRRPILRHAGRRLHGRVAQTKWPSALPGRFKLSIFITTDTLLPNNRLDTPHLAVGGAGGRIQLHQYMMTDDPMLSNE